MKNTPNAVLKAFKNLRDMFGEHVVYIGTRYNSEYYMFRFPDDSEYGFPNIVEFKKGIVKAISGLEAVKITSFFNLEN